MQAALDCADGGIETIIVEKSPSVGGMMARLDKTFPTIDCSICILGPKMVDVAQHEQITLHAYSEIEDIKGYVGNYQVKIRKKATYVDWTKCTGCGECMEKCPSKNAYDLFQLRRCADEGDQHPLPPGDPEEGEDRPAVLPAVYQRQVRRLRQGLPDQGHQLRDGGRDRHRRGGRHRRRVRVRPPRPGEAPGVRRRAGTLT